MVRDSELAYLLRSLIKPPPEPSSQVQEEERGFQNSEKPHPDASRACLLRCLIKPLSFSSSSDTPVTQGRIHLPALAFVCDQYAIQVEIK